MNECAGADDDGGAAVAGGLCGVEGVDCGWGGWGGVARRKVCMDGKIWVREVTRRWRVNGRRGEESVEAIRSIADRTVYVDVAGNETEHRKEGRIVVRREWRVGSSGRSTVQSRKIERMVAC